MASNPRLFRGTQDSLWRFWQHGVTSSFIDSYLKCKEQTRLSYVEGWSSRHVSLPLEFGTCVHWILEQAYNNMQAMDEKAVGEWVAEYEALWKKLVPAPTTYQLEQQELIYGLAEACLPAYFKRWDGDFTGTYSYENISVRPHRWDSLEVVFKEPWYFRDGKKTFLSGRRDGVFVDEKGYFWVFDTKCLSMINHDDILDTLPVNLQQMLYLYVTHLELTRKMGKPAYPAGMIMNVVRRPGHRQGKEERLADFLQRVKQDVSKPNRYDHFFVRYECRVTPGEIKAWVRDFLSPVIDSIRAWWEGTEAHHVNPLNLITKYGRCALFNAIVKNDYSNCYRREYCFSELAA